MRKDPEALSAAQRGKIRRISGAEKDPIDEGTGEINVVPFLDIITNVLMFVLATVAVTFTATIDVTPAKRGGRMTPALNLSVLVVNDGFSIKTQGGNVATGCSDVGTGLAIPKKKGEYDYDALRACATKLKSTTPEFKSENQVTLSANPSVPYQVVINTVDAVRKADNGDELFPDVAFAVAR
jgi:biopolymer transport protein TolR